jgi:hypothetical protein
VNLLSRGSMLRRLLIIVPVVLALILTSLFMPARQVTIKGIGTLSIGQEAAYASPAWLSGWSYRKKITIDHTKVDSVLTDFPVLVKLTSLNFGFSKALSTGNDIRFTSSDGKTLLKYERERHDSVNQLAEYWVKIPSVASAADTEFYMYYGKADATDGADPTNVWDTNYKGVWHKKDITTSTIADSTVNANNGTKKAANEPIQIDGKIAKGQDYDGIDDQINVGSGASIDNIFVVGGTISTWIYPTGWGGNTFGRILTKALNTATNNGHSFLISSNNFGVLNSFFFVRGFSTHPGEWGAPANSISLNAWHHVVVVYTDGVNNDPLLYLNGVLQTATELDIPSGSAQTDADQNMYIGDITGTARRVFDGIIDEVRVSTIARSAAWIKADYNSGNGTLLKAFGSEEMPVVSISVSPDKNWGTVYPGQTYSSATEEFTLTNTGDVPVNTFIQGEDATAAGAPDWQLSDTAQPGSDVYGLKFSFDLSSWAIIKKSTTVSFRPTALGVGASDTFGLQLLTPTRISIPNKTYSAKIYITAVQE